MTVNPRARLGVRLVPVAYGLLTDPGPEARGEIDGRRCIVPPNPKRWTIQIGYRLPSLEEWGRGLEPAFEVDEMEVTLGEVRTAAELDSNER